jgi:FAD/FMN-containing dehydrogenase
MLNPCDQAFADVLAARLPEGRIRPAEHRHIEEPRGIWHGRPGPVAQARTSEEVSTILRACAEARVGVLPWGGGTGLVGAQVKPDGPLPLILSVEKMNAQRGLWPDGNVIAVEAGMTLQAVQEAAAAAGRLFPLSLAAEGTATIGGNLATNAGGTAVLRYGNARDLALGIEAVLPDGSIFHGLRRLRKDNTGYDLRHLLIGSEGTLGVITAASLKLFPRPDRRVVALLVVPSPAAALRLLRRFETRVGGLISAFELLAKTGLEFLAEAGLDARFPLDPLPDWSVLIELGLPAAMEPEETMAALYEDAAVAGLVLDGVIAGSEAQAAAIWHVRETLPEANHRVGAVSSHDISLPLEAIPDFFAQGPGRVAPFGDFRINGFGHLGDGNLHYNVFPQRGHHRDEFAGVKLAVKEAVHDLVHAMGGSVSAEHGIGRLKTDDLVRYGDPAKVAAMRAIKAALDPHGIMNPGAVLA